MKHWKLAHNLQIRKSVLGNVLKEKLGIDVITNTDVITKIKNTFHTAGINSFSMYRYLTQPVDGIPKHTQRHDFKSLSFI